MAIRLTNESQLTFKDALNFDWLKKKNAVIFRTEIQEPGTYQSGDVTPSSWLPNIETPRPELDPEPNEHNESVQR